MDVRKFALISGAVYVVVGILGFVPAALQAPAADAPPLAVDASYGYLLGLFPVNLVHNLVHLAVGVAGLVASRAFGAARKYAVSLAVLYGVLTVLGVIPGLRTLFGLAPLFGHDIWLHALTAVAAGYFASRPAAGVETATIRRAA